MIEILPVPFGTLTYVVTVGLLIYELRKKPSKDEVRAWLDGDAKNIDTALANHKHGPQHTAWLPCHHCGQVFDKKVLTEVEQWFECEDMDARYQGESHWFCSKHKPKFRIVAHGMSRYSYDYWQKTGRVGPKDTKYYNRIPAQHERWEEVTL